MYKWEKSIGSTLVKESQTGQKPSEPFHDSPHPLSLASKLTMMEHENGVLVDKVEHLSELLHEVQDYEIQIERLNSQVWKKDELIMSHEKTIWDLESR